MLCCTCVVSCFTRVVSCCTRVVWCCTHVVSCCLLWCCVVTHVVFQTRSSVVTLSMKLCYKSSLTVDSTKNIIKLHIRCVMPYIRQLQILAVCRILLSNHFSQQEAPSLSFLYKYPKIEIKSSSKLSKIPSEFKYSKVH